MFHYFYFNDMLTLEDAQQAIPDVDKFLIAECYEEWLSRIERRLDLFYTAQWAAHEEYKGDDIGRDEHLELRRQWNKHLEFLEQTRNRKTTTRASDILVEVEREILVTGKVYKLLDGVWFNYLVDQYPVKIRPSRSLPYKDYLGSHYWKYVRALMLMFYGARCQGDDEPFWDSYWFGWESKLHVHHLTYKNRGNERFEDLTLLCEKCHAKAHADNPPPDDEQPRSPSPRITEAF